MEHCRTGHACARWPHRLIYFLAAIVVNAAVSSAALADSLSSKAVLTQLRNWQPFNTMAPSQELVDEAASLLGARVRTPNFEEQARMDGLSSGRLGWIRVKARTQSALTHAIIREAYSTFQDNEFDRFGLTTRRGKRGWEAVLLAERRAVVMSELPKALNPGDAFRAQATWALEKEAEGLLSWHIRLPSGETREGDCLSNGLCRIPTLAPKEAGWLVLQVMVERGLGPEVGYSKYIRVGEAEMPKSRRLTPSRTKMPGRRLLETLLNDVRREAELPPLEFDGLLHEIASKKVKVLANAGTFGHRLRGHSSPSTQLVEADIAFSRVVETIAAGSNVEALVKQWLASPAHRAKILDPTLRRAGLGLVKPAKGDRTFTGVLLLTDELG